ncbi:MAG TPA: hypothetical protein DF364_02220 [Ruminococcaceae bacterium]|nr:hypothetical protein [Oscillospiraceae bacterium]
MVSYHLQSGDEIAVSNVIRTTLSISNSRDYTPAFVQKNIESHSPQAIVERTADPHFMLWRTVNKSSAAVGL